MTEEIKIGLPRGIEAAWGVHERPRRGPKRGLSLGRIVETGVAVADAEGLDAVSMSRVAAELGTGTMSLYRYVSAKDELLTLMIDAAFGDAPSTVDPAIGWRAGMTQWAEVQFARMRQHPWSLYVPIRGMPMTPNVVLWLEVGLRCLRDTPLSEAQKMSILLLLSGFVRNVATLAADIETAERESGADVENLMPSYGRLIGSLTDPVRYPAFHAVIDSGFFDEPQPEEGGFPYDEFAFGLERLLDGIDVLLAKLDSSRNGETVTSV